MLAVSDITSMTFSLSLSFPNSKRLVPVGSKAGLRIAGGPSLPEAIHGAINKVAAGKQQPIQNTTYPEYLFVWPVNTALPIVSTRLTFTMDSVLYVHKATIYFSETAKHFSLGIKIDEVWYYYGMYYNCLYVITLSYNVYY